MRKREWRVPDKARRECLLAARLVPAEDVRLVGLVVIRVDPVERANLVFSQASRRVLTRRASERLWAEAEEMGDELRSCAML